MNHIQHLFVKNILAGRETSLHAQGNAFAAANIALCKYWGKRDVALNLPLNSSLSISLGALGTKTTLQCAAGDRVVLNGEEQAPSSSFARRICAFLDLFRPWLGEGGVEVRTENNIPTAAGLASSASGFAALVRALDAWAGWELDGRSLSMLARLGSGSAARSVFTGFVEWHAGSAVDGSDSYAEPLPLSWPALRVGVLELSGARKPVGSRDGMKRTVETSALYAAWPQQAMDDLAVLRRAITEQDFAAFGQAAERNALSMHATMLSAWPPLIYLQPESLAMIHAVHRLRSEGMEVYLTIDAGPNIKLLYLAENEAEIASTFPSVQSIAPFA